VVLQVAQVLLTLPYSFSQLGMLSGILLQIFYGFLGSWTAYLISVLYVEYRSRKEKEGVSFKNHVIQVWLLLLASSSSPLHFLLPAITCVTDYSFVPFHPGSVFFARRKKFAFFGVPFGRYRSAVAAKMPPFCVNGREGVLIARPLVTRR